MCDEQVENIDILLRANKPSQGMVDSTRALTEQIKKYGADSMPSDFMTKNELGFLLDGPYTDAELKALDEKKEPQGGKAIEILTMATHHIKTK